jgi:hypothetical protein
MRVLTRSRADKKVEGRIPRPPNSWILFRSAKVAEMKAKNKALGIPQAKISQMIGGAFELAQLPEHDVVNVGRATN